MTHQPNSTTPTTAPAKTEIADPEINMGALSIAMAQVDASVENFTSPLNSNAHSDQADFHRAELTKLRRDSDIVIAGRTAIANKLAAARSDLRRLFETADAVLKERERENSAAKASELADIKKSGSAHSAALNILQPSASDNVEAFRAAGSQKVS